MKRAEKIKLLELRDALIVSDIDEAYHILYSIADPKFEKINPWDEWEKEIRRYKMKTGYCNHRDELKHKRRVCQFTDELTKRKDLICCKECDSKCICECDISWLNNDCKYFKSDKEG